MTTRSHLLLCGTLAASVFVAAACRAPGSQPVTATDGSAASRTFVAPGAMDEYYLFYSGGHSGQVYVAGLPSMRHISTIPVFAPYPATGYGFDEESKAMLGDFTWGDVHHPGLSQTDGRYDGRWLFVNDNANNRVARIDLRDFKTKQVFGPIPNSSGTHGSSFLTENSEYVLVATRFSVPLPKGRYASVSAYETEFSGMVSGLKVDPKDGTLSVGWQVLTPPFNWDLGSTGKGPSSGWAFWTSYNSEMAYETLEATSTQADRDLAAIVNWRAAEQAVREGKTTMIGGVPVIDPAKVPGVLYFAPVPKSPHGIDTDPSGRWIAASGKLQPVVSVFDFEKIKTAIAGKQFEREVRGVPVLRYDAIIEGEVPIGLGPLHTQYDGKGSAYTSLFIESVVTKWRLPPWSAEDRADLSRVVLDKIPVHHNIGHLIVGGSDTREPYGKYLVAMNKLSKGRHISVGPSQPESSQLIDITGEKMTMLYEAFTEPEPHFAQILKADKIAPIEVYPRAGNTHPDAVWTPQEAGITRAGNKVTVKMMAIRSRFVPDQIEANAGDEVTIHVTNVEQTTDMIHGLGIGEQNVNVIVDPGETKTVRFTVRKTGVFPFYCTNFCSALHQEMSGYLAVKPKK
jgi:nitrous-oxide reductase